MKTTILFGGTSRERLVSVASAQALTTALPEVDLWFWDLDGTVHVTSQASLLGHEKPFEVPFKADGATLGTMAEALDSAAAGDRVLVLGLHGGTAENGQFQVLAESRGVPFTGSGSAASHLAFDKTAAKLFAGLAGVHSPSSVTLDEADEALAHYGRLIAKPASEGSSYGLIYVNSTQDIAAVRRESVDGLSDRALHYRSGSDLRCARTGGWLGHRPSAGRDRAGRWRLRLCRQVSEIDDAGNLPGAF